MSLVKQRASSSKEVVVIGIDILPGRSVSSRRQPHYALVVLRNGEVIGEYEDASLSRFIRLVWEYRPTIIAIDNVYELAPDYNGLVKILSMLPPDIQIVQVTGWGPHTLNIRSLAKSLGVSVHGNLSPLKTAYVAALAAYKGYGYQVRLLEEKTKIIVSRGRSVSHGGMSYNRYVRSVRASILNMTKEIKKILDRNKLDYDLVFRKSRGGLEGSVFIVYAPRSRLKGLIKQVDTKTVRVEIKPVYSKKVSREPIRASYKPVILGIDPGISTGIAVIDLDGTPLLLYSSKNIDRSDIINMVSSIGSPVLVATDVSTPPDSIRKLAATLNVQVYTPPRDLSNDEKNNIIYSVLKKYPWIDIEDTHERDALAAAYKAYVSYESKFRQLEAHLSNIGIELDVEQIKADIIRGKTLAEAIEKEVEKRLEEARIEYGVKKEVKKEAVGAVYKRDEKLIETLRERIRVLEAEKKRLVNTVKELRDKVVGLEIELKSIKSIVSPDENLLRELNRLRIENERLVEELRSLRKKIESLKKENIELVNALEEIVREGYVIAPIYSHLSIVNVERLIKKGVKAIYVRDPSIYELDTLKKLKNNRIALLVDNDIEYPIRIPVVNIKHYKHYIINEKVYVEPAILKRINDLWKVVDEEDREERFKRIVDMIREYKEERKKELGVEKLSSRTI